MTSCFVSEHDGGLGVRLLNGPELKLFILVGLDWSTFLCCFRGSTGDLHFFTDFKWCCLAVQAYPTATQHVVYVESSSLLFVVLNCYLFVNRDDSWRVRGLSCEPDNRLNSFYHYRN